MDAIKQLDLVKVGDILKIKWPSSSVDGRASDVDGDMGSMISYTSCEVQVLQIKSSKKTKLINLYDKSYSDKPQRMSSNLKYKLFFLNNGETHSSRLYDLKYKIKSRATAANIGTSHSDYVDLQRLEEEPASKKSRFAENHVDSSVVTLTTRTLVDPSKVNKRLPSHRFILAPMVGASELPFRLLCRRYGSDLGYTPMISSERFVEDSAYRAEEFQTCAEDQPVVAHFSANNPDVSSTSTYMSL
jgi:hypothetical protein